MMLQQIGKYLNITAGIIVIISLIFLSLVSWYPSLIGSYLHIQNIEIEGSKNSNKEKIESIIPINEKSLFTLDLNDTALEIQKLNWVKKVNIKKQFPNTIKILIFENDPFAYLLKDQKTFLIDIDGEIISEENALNNIDEYLIVTGKDSQRNLSKLIRDINIAYPEILASLYELEFIEERRWDIIINNNLRIKLSESDVQNSLINLKKLIKDNKILKSNIIEVDLRISDRAIFRLEVDEELKLKIEEV